MIADRVILRAIRALDAERAHRLAIKAFRMRARLPEPPPDPRLVVHLFGLVFPNPVGLAAGFDKNGEVPDAMLAAGFGFVEVGTVTPAPQEGNQRPRIVRLPADRAVINRLGFNNLGHTVVGENLETRRGRGGIVGINIGANADSADRIGDYCSGIARFARLASYVAVNISSPNTPGLRELQEAGWLDELLARIMETREDAAVRLGRPVPLLLKISPDLDDARLCALIDVVQRHAVDGMIISNTTVSRDGLRSARHTAQAGGLSGPPLFDRSTAMLARARQVAGPDLPLIGVGGVDSARAAWRKIAAGANLVQLYTGIIYEGPGLPRAIVDGLVRELDNRHFDVIGEARAIETQRWAAAWPRQSARPRPAQEEAA